MKPPYTTRQGQFLAFIQQYTTLHGRPPAEAEMVEFFQVTAPERRKAENASALVKGKMTGGDPSSAGDVEAASERRKRMIEACSNRVAVRGSLISLW